MITTCYSHYNNDNGKKNRNKYKNCLFLFNINELSLKLINLKSTQELLMFSFLSFYKLIYIGNFCYEKNSLY